jgi:hypothetical protein
VFIKIVYHGLAYLLFFNLNSDAFIMSFFILFPADIGLFNSEINFFFFFLFLLINISFTYVLRQFLFSLFANSSFLTRPKLVFLLLCLFLDY